MSLLFHQICEYIVSDILEKTKYLGIALTGGFLIGILSIKFLRFNKKSMKCSLLTIYFIMLFIVTLLEREPGSRTNVSLILFETIGNARNNTFVIENIFLFIPFGVLVSWTWNCMRKPLKCTLAGFCFSVMIEMIQLMTGRGYFQVDDMVTNTLGAWIGSVVFWIIIRKKCLSNN